jgi:sugar-specific transcriptional regulator TrmB
MKKQSALTLLGLHDEEIRIYETLITKGPLSPTEICVYTKLHRPNAYVHIANLEQKNLISIVPHGKRKKYSANSPKLLKELSVTQEKMVLEEIMRLEEIETPKEKTPGIVVRYGREAIKMLYEEAVMELKKGDVYYRYHSIDTEAWVPGMYATAKSRRVRDSKDLQRLVITNEENMNRKRQNPNRHIKTVPKKFDLFKHNVGQLMYGNKTAIIDYNNEVAVIIDSAPITMFQKAIFKTFFHYL